MDHTDLVKGCLLFVLNTHMPFVRNAAQPHSEEENWLFEAITESYIPLIEALSGLVRDGARFRITISLTPCLVAQLADPLLQQRYLGYLEDRVRLAEREMARLGGRPDFLRLAQMYHQHFVRCRRVFAHWNHDLTAAFAFLRDAGCVELLTSAATHAYLPLWTLYPRAARLQIQLGLQQHQAVFGERPQGFWLPECGFAPCCGRSPGIDELLQEEGIRYTFLNANGILNGHPRPRFGVHAPVHSPHGVVAFGRDWGIHDLVWLEDKGYPGDPCYLDGDRDIGYELELEQVAPFTHIDRPAGTGIKYHRGKRAGGGAYDPDAAFRRCDAHAQHFFHWCQERVQALQAWMGRKPVLVAMFDTEHFGHWWREGPTWLELVLRKLVYDQQTVELVTASDYLRQYPVNQEVTPSLSSWGYQGYSESWLMGRNHWLYPRLYRAIERLDEFDAAAGIAEEALRLARQQYLRELLLAQSSDFAFMMWRESSRQYAEERVRGHVENMEAIYAQLRRGEFDRAWLGALQEQNNIFSTQMAENFL
ncbi:MAG: DUF1957 domain-containing protein [Anaerolineae bacterium]|nr:DUF1957 domain-containing protein [Anaerolineae bacterium]